MCEIIIILWVLSVKPFYNLESFNEGCIPGVAGVYVDFDTRDIYFTGNNQRTYWYRFPGVGVYRLTWNEGYPRNGDAELLKDT